MAAIAFDTLDATKTLRSAGIDERTAEAIVVVVPRTTELPPTEHLATREQLDAVKIQLAEVDKRLTGRVNDLRTLLLAAFGFNLAGFLGVTAFLDAVLKHA